MKKLMKSVLACLLAFAMVLTVMPVNSYAAAKKSVVVTNQEQLEKALKNGATNIVIKTNKNVKITIPATKKAAKASISVQAKNATITNNASVKSIVIKDAKAFVESGKNNDIKITDSKLSLTVAKGSKGADIKVAKKDAEIKVVAKGDVASVTVAKTADVTLTVNKTATVASVNVAAKGASVDLNAKGTVSDVKVSEKAADTKLNINASGKVENVQIDAKADVAVAGSTTEAVKVTVNAKDTTIKAETAVETTLNADAKVDLSKGAEGSKVTTAENVKVDVANNTADKVTVTDSTGKETSVDAGKTETTKDESKKDDEKKDDQKKDDQSSGGNSGGSSGTVTPTPIPSEQDGKIGTLYVQDKDLLAVYLDDVDEVPASFDKKNIEIKDSKKNTVNVKEVQKDENGYFIWLESNMQNNTTYTFTMHLNGKKYVKDYMYDEDALNKLKKQMSGMSAVIKNAEVPASETALSSPTLFEDALLDFFAEEYEKENEDDLFATDYEVIYLKERSRNEKIVTSSMAVNLYYEQDKINMCYGKVYDVKFACKGETFVVTEPTIEYKLKDSIVVKGEDYYKYACVEKDSNINVEKIEKWVSPDRMGRCQFTDLKANTKYLLYARYGGDSKLSASIEFELNGNGKSVICLAESLGNTGSIIEEKVKAGGLITVPLNVRFKTYGKFDPKGEHGDVKFTCEDEALNEYLNNYATLQGSDELSVELPVPAGLSNGEHEISFDYYFKCNAVKSDGTWDEQTELAASKPIHYTVKFQYEGANDVVTAPEIKYQLKNSIVIHAEDNLWYACVKKGISIYENQDIKWTNGDVFGNIEFTGLDADAEYTIYATTYRNDGIYRSVNASTDSNVNKPIIALAEADGEKTISKGVTAGESVYIPLENLKIACYGVPKDAWESIHVDVDLQKCGEAASAFKVSVKKDDQGQNCWLIDIAKDVAAGSYQMTLKYSYGCVEREDDNATMLAESVPLVYEVTLNVK